MRNFILIMTMFLGLSQGSVFAADDHGNTAAFATPIAVNSSTAGVLDTYGFLIDADYFQIDVVSAGGLIVKTTGTTNTVGNLYDSYGNIVATNNDTFLDLNFKISKFLSAGTYFIEVRGFPFNITGSYVLESTFTVGGFIDDHGDTRALATPIPFNGRASGFLDVYSDVDYLSINLTEGGVLDIYTAYSTDDIQFSLLDGYSNLAFGDSLGVNISQSVPAGIYYIEVRSWFPSLPFNPRDFTLVTAFTPVVVVADDHGNTLASATSISANSVTAGVIDTYSDVDFFQIDLVELGTLIIRTTGTTDTVGFLYDGYGNIIAENDDTAFGLNFEITQSLAAGSYFLEVSGFGGFVAGNYVLESNFVAGAPILDVHGDTPQTATVISVGSVTDGIIGSNSDLDSFRFDIINPGTFIIETTGQTNLLGALIDEQGNILDSVEDPTVNNIFMMQDLAVGRYYILLLGYDTGAYTLSLSEEAVPLVEVDPQSACLSLNKQPYTLIFFIILIVVSGWSRKLISSSLPSVMRHIK